MVLLSVSDPGIGIPADQQQHLFERYFRARNVSTRSYGGLGLGLYICHDIVERHGGRIWVESEVGRGSTFYVALPTLRAVPATPPACLRAARALKFLQGGLQERQPRCPPLFTSSGQPPANPRSERWHADCLKRRREAWNFKEWTP